MSDIFLLEADPGFRSLVTAEDEAVMQLLLECDGRSKKDRWVPFKVEYEEDSLDLPLADFPEFFLPHIPIFSARAAEALQPVLQTNGELLPLASDDEEYFAFNVKTLSDALSTNESDIVYFPSGTIMRVNDYVLNPKGVGSTPIFKLSQTPLMAVFVTDDFVRMVESHGLLGFSFKKVALSVA